MMATIEKNEETSGWWRPKGRPGRYRDDREGRVQGEDIETDRECHLHAASERGSGSTSNSKVPGGAPVLGWPVMVVCSMYGKWYVVWCMVMLVCGRSYVVHSLKRVQAILGHVLWQRAEVSLR
jgi:hypothetical protein